MRWRSVMVPILKKAGSRLFLHESDVANFIISFLKGNKI